MDELPKFEIDPGKINILESPTDFYDALRNGIQSSSRRIVLSSLYLGSKETELVRRKDLILIRLK